MSTIPCSGILVVEDDDDIRDAIVDILVDEGYPACGAVHGEAALAWLRGPSPRPCLILLDIMMPVMDGRAFRVLQLLDPVLRSIPIVVLTAHANICEIEKELEASGAFRKPLTLEELFAVAERHCGKPGQPG